MSSYHFLLISQIDLFKNQVLEEVLRERANFYISQNKKQDFWILIFPNFIKSDNFLNTILSTNYFKKNQDSLYCLENKYPFFAAIISSNKDFINWVTLRIGFFETIDFFKLENNLNNTDNSINKEVKSNGLRGVLNFNKLDINPLSSCNFYLHPDIYLNKYKRILKYSYSLFN